MEKVNEPKSWFFERSIRKQKTKKQLKKKTQSVHVTTWISHENLVPNERNQSEVTCMILFVWNVQDKEIHGQNID